MNRLNKIESAVFLYCRFFLFLSDPFFQIIYSVRWQYNASYDQLTEMKNDLNLNYNDLPAMVVNIVA